MPYDSLIDIALRDRALGDVMGDVMDEHDHIDISPDKQVCT